MRRMSALLAGLGVLALLAGCAPRYTYHYDTTHVDTTGNGRVKGYYLADGTYMKVHPVTGAVKVNKGKSKKKGR